MKYLDRLSALAKSGSGVGEEPAKPAKTPFDASAATPPPTFSNSSTAPGPMVMHDSGDLLALVERVARAYSTPREELEEMKRLALADPAAAWSAFLTTVRIEGIQ